MSISSEITRISGNVADAMAAIADKGVTVPAGSTSDDLADLIAQIQQGGGGGMSVVETQDSHGGTIVTITGEEVKLQSKTATPTTSSQAIQPDSGFTGLSQVTVNAIPSQYIVPTGTKSITANGTGIDVAQYASVDVAVPAPAPNLQAKTNIAPSTSSQTITADNGYDGLSSVQINAMPSGTAGTPTATKGTVSNHSVSVTPSVTNTTGYITGSTKTGTAVTVSASELVSGNKEITANGTNIDVSTYSTVSVAVSGVNIDTKTATATASTYPVSLEFTGMQGQPKVFSLRTTSQISSSGSTTYYYIANIHYNGTSTSGNVFRIGSTRRIDNVTSGYSWSYSGSTLTITSSAASRSASPGAFYSAYELVYVY